MNIAFYISSVLTAAVLAFIGGLWLGRRENRKEPEESRRSEEDLTEEQGAEKNRAKESKPEEYRIEGRREEGRSVHPAGWAIGSPAAGEVSLLCEGKRKGVIICPQEGRLYAPASGKVTKLYPTGNAFLLRTEIGIELLIQAGVRTEELEGLYYRPRVVQNEIVNKGKLLLEYDLEAVMQEGYDASVLLSVADAQQYRDITVTQAQRVRNGEPVLWVCR